MCVVWVYLRKCPQFSAYEIRYLHLDMNAACGNNNQIIADNVFAFPISIKKNN